MSKLQQFSFLQTSDFQYILVQELRFWLQFKGYISINGLPIVPDSEGEVEWLAVVDSHHRHPQGPGNLDVLDGGGEGEGHGQQLEHVQGDLDLQFITNPCNAKFNAPSGQDMRWEDFWWLQDSLQHL